MILGVAVVVIIVILLSAMLCMRDEMERKYRMYRAMQNEMHQRIGQLEARLREANQ